MIVIVNYGLGNLFSVAKAFEMIGTEVIISDKIEDIQKADKIVLPGVGSFAHGMENLQDKGLVSVLTEEVMVKKKPFLGICLGLQLLAEKGFENGEHKGLGWIKGSVVAIDAGKHQLKVPHIGWSEVQFNEDCQLLKGIKQGEDFYFVHSYQLVCEDPKVVVATATYGEKITAAIQYKNIFATQFHPEKSQDKGLKILENFINWEPEYA